MGANAMRLGRALLVLFLAATPAVAAAPVALVTDVSGEVSPAVGLFHELEAGTELTLGAGAGLTVEHYATCEAVTVTGGSVLVRETGLDLERADVAGRTALPCAQTATLAPQQDTVNAGVLLRGVAVLPRVPLVPQIVVAGGGAGFDILRVERDGRAVAALPVRAGRVEWPEGGLFLTDQAAYVLVLAGPAGEHRARVVADRGAVGRTVLRP
jgi:hypothetical protein